VRPLATLTFAQFVQMLPWVVQPRDILKTRGPLLHLVLTFAPPGAVWNVMQYHNLARGLHGLLERGVLLSTVHLSSSGLRGSLRLVEPANAKPNRRNPQMNGVTSVVPNESRFRA